MVIWGVNYMLLCLYSVAQSCPTLCIPTDCSPPGSLAHGTLQARMLEWVAVPSSGGSSDSGIKPASPALQAILNQCATHLHLKPELHNMKVNDRSLC